MNNALQETPLKGNGMSTYRYVLQGCSDATLAAAVQAIRTKISGIDLSVEKSSKGYYFISVDTTVNHELMKDAISGALLPLRITIAVVESWTPTNFSEFS